MSFPAFVVFGKTSSVETVALVNVIRQLGVVKSWCRILKDIYTECAVDIQLKKTAKTSNTKRSQTLLGMFTIKSQKA